MQSKSRNSVRVIVQVGLLIAIAVVVRNFGTMIPIGGIPALRISFSEIFTKVAAILFGPLYGGISSGILDVLGFLLAGGAYGPYLPWMTVTAILGGILTGFLWILAVKIDYSKAVKYYLATFAVIGAIGLINQIILSFFSASQWARYLLSLKDSKGIAVFALLPAALIIIAAVGFGFYLLNMLLKKASGKWRVNEDFVKVLIATGIAGLVVSTLNTVILSATAQINFFILWVPRIIKEVFMVIVQAYVVTYLVTLYRKYLAKL